MKPNIRKYKHMSQQFYVDNNWISADEMRKRRAAKKEKEQEAEQTVESTPVVKVKKEKKAVVKTVEDAATLNLPVPEPELEPTLEDAQSEEEDPSVEATEVEAVQAAPVVEKKPKVVKEKKAKK